MPDAIDSVVAAEGWPARYGAALKHLLVAEGGYVNDPADRGGATKYGISLRFLASEGAFDDDRDGRADFDLDMDGDIDGADVRKLTVADAARLYYRCFWLAMDCGGYPAPLGEMLFDQAVNGGKVAARKLLQRAVNTCLMQAPASQRRPGLLKVDGVAGALTREAVMWTVRHPVFGIDKLAEAFRDAVRERYRTIAARNPSQKRFLKGWLARADRLGW